MYGAIIGDLAGSIYEYNQIEKVTSINVRSLIEKDSFFSDDTILTVAILDAILNNKDYEYYLKMYARDYFNYQPDVKPYFSSPFSPGFTKWVNGNEIGKSSGNGAMMRISSVGYLFDTEDDIYKNVVSATKPSHNASEAIECANIVAIIILYARMGMEKEEIIKKLNLKLNYKPFKNFNYTCYETLDNCLYALFNSNTFEESLKKVISFGGDTDTNACIVGSMAEALYGIDTDLVNLAKSKIPKEFVNKLEIGYLKIKKLV